MEMPSEDTVKAEEIAGETEPLNPVSAALGESLKKLRLGKEKSQENLAFDAGVDRTYVSAIERGIANPSVHTLANICFGLNITLADLFAPVTLALSPEDGKKRRANRASPQLKPKKSRLR